MDISEYAHHHFHYDSPNGKNPVQKILGYQYLITIIKKIALHDVSQGDSFWK
jgi:hypothetical protein